MTVGYMLVNQTRREIITFAHIPAASKRELSGNPVAAAITTWYLLACAGDQLAFVSDSNGEWPFPTGSRAELVSYREMTDAVVAALIENGIVDDQGRQYFDPNEPDVYLRRLKNIWLDG